ncbi:hypothetical protein DLJ53_19170 [Acuticoccus sediminis]|uniref:Uncharacterized protein n=1 Tax=Acuticoccus sediminis TaxID=2184697 RepID=A0A8B2NPF3_9HYPH|nr:hypothetical protein [Acuticoccus sediminis]RAH99867.1 hypothetical protein DLJ53_19170 [Acuticoccus sediminis]
MAKAQHDHALIRLCDEFGRLEARIRLYCIAAEAIARDELDHGPLLRATEDLGEFVDDFKILLNDYHSPQKGAEE